MAKQKRRHLDHDAGRDSSGSVKGGTQGTGVSGAPVEGSLRAWFAGKGTVIRAVSVFVLLMTAFHLFAYTPLARSDARVWYLTLIAQVSGYCLDGLGYDTTVSNTSITSPRFSVGIARGCDALLPIGAFVAAVVASPVAWRAKLPGLLIGTASLLVINLIRIITLFAIGVHFPRAFHLIHFEVWQALFIALAIIFWAIWVQWATKPRRAEGHVSS